MVSGRSGWFLVGERARADCAEVEGWGPGPRVPARAEFAFQELFLEDSRAFLVVPGHSTIA